MHFRQNVPLPASRTGLAGRTALGVPGVLGVLGVLAVLAGCTDSAPASLPAPTPSTAPATSPSPVQQLAAVAALARAATYDATYTAHSDAQGSQPARTSTIEVYRTTSKTRLDVDEQPTHVLIQVDATGTSSCTVSAGTASACVQLAGPGSSIPANIPDPGLQHTFTSTLDVLASGSDLTVAGASSIAASDGAPAARCFAVVAAPAEASVTPGTYCFSASGIVVRAEFRSSLLQLVTVGDQPVSSDFSLPASPVPVSTTASSPAP